MARNNLLLLLLLTTCLAFVTDHAYGNRSAPMDQKQGKSWCMGNLKDDPDKLQAFIDYACGVADCSAIQPGGPCFEPDLIPAHANYALTLIYRTRGECQKHLAHVTYLDPSYGGCQYP